MEKKWISKRVIGGALEWAQTAQKRNKKRAGNVEGIYGGQKARQME